MKQKFFYKDIALEVPVSVYYPREDSLLLAEILEKEELNGKKIKSALDMGCGSGLLALLLAKSGSRVTAADINEDAVKISEENAARNSVQITAVKSDLFSNIKDDFDLIVFNPPYLPFDEPKDLQWSGGIDMIKKFLEEAKSHLKKDGKIIFVASTLTAQEKEITGFIEKNNYRYKILARKKIPWEELVVFEVKNN